jgi:integrase
MAFISDKEELKPGLIIFRRSDVQHHNWYCRVKLPKADRYKTVSLKTSDINVARSLAWDQDGEVRYAIKRTTPCSAPLMASLPKHSMNRSSLIC